MSRKTLSTLLACCLALALSAAPARADFGLKDLGVAFTNQDGSVATQAGSHPFAFTTTIAVNTSFEGETEVPDDEVRDLVVDFPPGLVGTPEPVPTCPATDFLREVGDLPDCPDATAVGKVKLKFGFGKPESYEIPVYNLVPAPGVAAKLGFMVAGLPVITDVGVNPEPPSNLVSEVTNITQAAFFYRADLTVWGVPASPDHDAERGSCLVLGGSCEADIPEEPFITLPRSCTGPLVTTFRARSWQDPSTWVTATALTDDGAQPPSPQGMTGCAKLGFSPTIAAQPTATAASAPTGLDFDLDIDDPGLRSPKEGATAHSDIRKAVVTLPEGVTLNPSVAEGLEVCSPGDFDRERVDSAFGEGCPAASKVGDVEVVTPLLPGELLRGQVYVATPHENPFDSLIALYMVIKHPSLGILVKLPGRVEPDPDTGRLTTTFGEAGHEIPQFPFSHFRFHFREGGRSPLITPPRCGGFEARATFTPWAGGPEASATGPFEIDSGVNGGPCPSGEPPFEPGFAAGSLNNAAGAFTPFAMRLTRRDGDQDLARFTATLPPGVVGKIAGVERCSDAAIAAAKAKSGKEELASPSCPAASRLGSTLAGAGVGSQLTYVPGSLYLAGPFAGAPLSVVAVTPAVAGPFDVGTVVVREALRLDRVTAQVTADGSASDRIPHQLEGIPLALRDLRVRIDRDNFILNPTSCAPAEVEATMTGSGTLFDATGETPVSLADRFQAAGCRGLGFAPRVGLRLFGGTRRGAFPALRLVYAPRPGTANLRRLSLTLPSSAFIEQGHFRTICTRVQFRADKCPQAAIYGRAVAHSPLLDEPLRGPVYLRSSENPLPDAVLDLRGIVDVEVGVRIDSVKGRLRATTINAPDVPVSRVVVQMQGGQKGLFVNSRHLCHKPKRNRARINTAGHNNARRALRPLVRPLGCRRGKGRGKGARVASVGAGGLAG